ncbi:MAG: GntR family transcriptional regulator [Candidatus Methylomirabilales bacterium]
MALISSGKLPRNDRRSLAYDRLKRMIVTARLRPGSSLVERDIAAELKISRTPVREAIARLVAEGLLVRRPRRGHLVPAMGAQEVEGLYAVREALEALAVRLAIGRMGNAAHRQIDAAIEALAPAARAQGEERTGARPGMRIHEVIVRHSGNPFLYETWRRLIEKILPYVWIETLYADDAARTLREHRRLRGHIRARNAVAAEKLLRAHIGRARDNLVRALALQAGGTASSDAIGRDGRP